jgi:hypothetical protein
MLPNALDIVANGGVIHVANGIPEVCLLKVSAHAHPGFIHLSELQASGSVARCGISLEE